MNATFYRLPSLAMVEGWVSQTPPGFVFAVKASRFLTHVRRLAGIADGLARFYERLGPLVASGKLGPVLWQLPESFQRDDARLAGALELLPPGRHAFEFRHASWFAVAVYQLLGRHDAALVIGDHPQRPFQSLEATASWRYLRFHYGGGDRGGYTQRELGRWAQRLDEWRATGELFAYFNNDWEGLAPRDAADLRVRLERLAA